MLKVTKQNINEENIKRYIDERVLLNMSFLNIFLDLQSDVIEKSKGDKFSSIKNNYTSMFLYEIMNRDCTTKEFKAILNESSNYENLFRFFKSDDDFDNQRSIYDKMSWFFLKKDNDKIIPDKNKIKYIECFITEVRDKNLLDFHSSRIDFFLSYLIKSDLIIGENIMNILVNTQSMLKSDFGKYNSMIYTIIDTFATSSYEKNESIFFKSMENNKVFKKVFDDYLIHYSLNNKYQVNSSWLHYLENNKIDFLDIFIQSLIKFKDKISEDDYVKLLDDSIYNLEKSVKKTKEIININKIDVNKNLLNNIPYIIVLSELINLKLNNQIIGENKDLINYLKENLPSDNWFNKDHIHYKLRFLDLEDRSNNIINYLEKLEQYNKMDNNLPFKNIINKKLKI